MCCLTMYQSMAKLVNVNDTEHYRSIIQNDITKCSIITLIPSVHHNRVYSLDPCQGYWKHVQFIEKN